MMKNRNFRITQLFGFVLLITVFSCSQKSVQKDKSKLNPSTMTDKTLIERSSVSAVNAEQMLQNALRVLKASNSGSKSFEGITYDLTTTNELPANWIIQSAPTDTKCQLLESIQALLTEKVANYPNQPHFIDLLQLGNDAVDDKFQLQIIDQICQIAARTRQTITIRYLEGNPALRGVLPDKYFHFFNEMKQKYAGGLTNVTLYAATFNYPWDRVTSGLTPGSWNHAKIVAVDGVASIVGGQNYWSDYIPRPGSRPPYDVSMRLNGKATSSAHGFANFLWSYVANPSGKSTQHKSWKFGAPNAGNELPPAFSSSNFPSPTSGGIPVLAVGNLGLWEAFESRTVAEEFVFASTVSPTNTYSKIMSATNKVMYFPFSSWDYSLSKSMQASTTTRNLMFHSVETNGHIRISQQKIANTDAVTQSGYVIWPGEFLDAMIYALKDKNASIDILLSNHVSGSNIYGGYSDDMGGLALQGVIHTKLLNALGGDAHRTTELMKKLTIKQMPSNSYNHAKVWIVDNKVFYIGSDNIYPGYLQEYGYVVGDERTTSYFIANYWDNVWAKGVNP
jgi:hypothetical protein